MYKFKIGDRVKFSDTGWVKGDAGTITRFCCEYVEHTENYEAWWVKWDSDGAERWIDAGSDEYSLIDEKMKTTPHKYSELIHAWADGAEIKFWVGDKWVHIKNPRWDEDYKYRVKPQETKRYFHVDNFDLDNNSVEGMMWEEDQAMSGNYIEITYDAHGKVTNVVFHKIKD